MSNISLEAIDLVGAAHRRLAEAASHLNSSHPAAIDCDGVRRHLMAIDALVASLAGMQQAAARESANGAEQHAQ